ncbi:Wadjet anti-phage system protein JetD domain-containing protein [Jeotgalibacillus sp. JSM ZJ347]|uniref:Wadjet anti-phage system protein JetD domain-containing protein n=1 Tax=Jeotgalibacillus sp. JSM ZJ347 TaxID=3342117 RepID=UPI0035A97201
MNNLTQPLRQYKNSTITLDELERLIRTDVPTYEAFAALVLELEEQGVLSIVKSQGRNTRRPSLAYRYRIDKRPLQQQFHQTLKQHRLLLHSSIQLDAYFSLDSVDWEEDVPYIEKIDVYLKQYGFPKEEVPAPERSVSLVGDEKWITERNGKALLERIGLWEAMKVMPVSDPLMFALNPRTIQQHRHYHLVVENKTTYQGLLDALPETLFTTLIYGCGKKIIKSIEQFDRQFPVEGEHIFYYFGDLDLEGLFIWYQLSKKQTVHLAKPFYLACLEKPVMKGKTNHRRNHEAVEVFLAHFTPSERKQMNDVLDHGGYYAQEVLMKHELQHIWRDAAWTD